MKQSKNGFSIIELIFTIVIASIIFGVVFSETEQKQIETAFVNAKAKALDELSKETSVDKPNEPVADEKPQGTFKTKYFKANVKIGVLRERNDELKRVIDELERTLNACKTEVRNKSEVLPIDVTDVTEPTKTKSQYDKFSIDGYE